MTEDLGVRRKRLLFRASHRGTKEADLLIGTFAERHLATMSPGELDAFESLLQHEDAKLVRWITGQAEPPPEVDPSLMARLRSHRIVS
ncbi:MAG: succinate dehydrogenase assembly factor 2 [Rhodospirillales bacterium]|nr:succinate dehydrogenase assembly factor 2 [Rhodospirillales bacterium]